MSSTHSNVWKRLATALMMAASLGALQCSAFSYGVAFAQDEERQDAPLAPFQHSDLKFNSTDLVFKRESLGGSTKDLDLKDTGTEIRIALSGDVLFNFDKAEIRKEAEPLLEQVAALLKEKGSVSGTVEGHTDSKGDDAYNEKLSRKRADSVKRWLASRAVDTKKLGTRGYGESKPAAPNQAKDGSDDPAGRQKNRRVEIAIKKQS